MNYLAASAKIPGNIEWLEEVSKEKPDSRRGLEAIKEAVIKGKLKTATKLTKQALDRGADPQHLINRYLIAGLNVVGDRFELKKIFVPRFLKRLHGQVISNQNGCQVKRKGQLLIS